MKQRRFTEEQIITILKSVEDGQKVGDVCRTHAISEATYYRWKSTYGGMEVSQVQRLRHLEDENRRLKHIVADLTLDNAALKDVIEKKW
jgi:putative transposase